MREVEVKKDAIFVFTALDNRTNILPISEDVLLMVGCQMSSILAPFFVGFLGHWGRNRFLLDYFHSYYLNIQAICLQHVARST